MSLGILKYCKKHKMADIMALLGYRRKIAVFS